MEYDDPILQRAVERLAELDQEREKIKEFLSTYRMLANSLKLESANTAGTNAGHTHPMTKAVDSVEREAGREAVAPDATPAKRVRVSDNPKPAVVVAAAADVIRAAGRPLTRRKIHKALAARGVVVNGADPIKALGTMLWRSGKEELVQITGKGYGLKGADYDLENLPSRSQRVLNLD